MSARVARAAGVGLTSASRSGCPHTLSPMRKSTGTSTTRTTRGVTSSISTLNRAISLMCGDSKPSFRGLLERQHLVAPIEIDDLAVLDHPGEVFGVLQDGDVRDRVFVPHGDIGELPRRHLADLAVEADGKRIVTGRRDDRFHRRIAAVTHEDFQLLGVQLAMAGERIVAGVGAVQKLDTELARLV